MTETSQHKPEALALLERGGITAAHWVEILPKVERHTRGFPDIHVRDARIKFFGEAVIAGQISDSGNIHRDFLGNRHMQTLANYLANDFPLTPLQEAALGYFTVEERAFANLNDFYFQRMPSFETNSPFVTPLEGEVRDEEDLSLMSLFWLTVPSDNLPTTANWLDLLNAIRAGIPEEVLVARLKEYIENESLRKESDYRHIIPNGWKVKEYRGWENQIPQIA